MKGNRLFLGIDTSCYTTSVAAASDGKVLSFKKPLEVKPGQCGLRQSEAFFQHSKNLPKLFEQLSKEISLKDFSSIVITASKRPRNIEGSYMPVFLAGQGYAGAIASLSGARYFETSHQDGHIMAAIYSTKKYDLLDKGFLAYHLSGGTTELLLCKRDNSGFLCSILGKTLDLPAGQFVDRVGVRAGFDFPAGKFVDTAATMYIGEKPRVRISTTDMSINFSGEETRCKRMHEAGEDKEKIAYYAMKCISESIKATISAAIAKYGTKDVLMTGGVASSKFLRQQFSDMPDVYFASNDLSTDNAVGTCFMGKLYMGEDFFEES